MVRKVAERCFRRRSSKRKGGDRWRTALLHPAGPLTLLLTVACAHQPAACADGRAGSLACRAGSGDQLAQLRLGLAYELGVGVPQDFAAAARLYRQAAASVSGTTYVYSPGVGKSPGRVLPLRTGPDRAGLPEAKRRLAELYLVGRGVKLDRERAIELLQEAAEAGNPGAARRLRELALGTI